MAGAAKKDRIPPGVGSGRRRGGGGGGAGICPFKLVDLEPNLPFKQSITTSSGLHLGHFFYRILFCSFVYVSPTQWHTLEGCPDPTERSE